MWEITFEIFIKSLRFESPWVRKSGFYKNVCLSVGHILDIELSDWIEFGHTLSEPKK